MPRTTDALWITGSGFHVKFPIPHRNDFPLYMLEQILAKGGIAVTHDIQQSEYREDNNLLWIR